MKRSIAVLGGVILAASLVVGLYAHDKEHGTSKEGKAVTVEGELIDTACFITSGGESKGADHAECATKCMSSGVPAGILPDHAKDSGAVVFLLTNPQPLAQYAGQTIKVEGTAYEEKHAIDVKKLSVKDGANWKEVQLKDEHHGEGEHGESGGHKDTKTSGHKDHH